MQELFVFEEWFPKEKIEYTDFLEYMRKTNSLLIKENKSFWVCGRFIKRYKGEGN